MEFSMRNITVEQACSILSCLDYANTIITYMNEEINIFDLHYKFKQRQNLSLDAKEVKLSFKPLRSNNLKDATLLDLVIDRLEMCIHL